MEALLPLMYEWGSSVQERVSRADPSARDDLHSRMMYGFWVAQYIFQGHSK